MIQYGLIAFNEGKISAGQFVELNERIGGYDEDGIIVAVRMRAEPDTLRLAYQHGLVLTGGGALSEVPIIDWRPYVDDLADLHDRVRSFQTRARLLAANGHADNHVMIVGPPQNSMMRVLYADTITLQDEYQQELLRLLDRWLDHIAADRASGTRSAKVSRNKPGDLTDGCWTVSGERITEPASYEGQGKNKGRCNQEYPPHGHPRIAAGAPVAGDILKCALKPIRPEDYAHSFSADQIQRLKAIFPGGVCDYSRPGVGQEVTRSTWLKYDEARFDRLVGAMDVLRGCAPLHVGFFDDVTTVSGGAVFYRNGNGPWAKIPVDDLDDAHSIARLPGGKWLINDTDHHRMIQLEDLSGRGEITIRSELGGFQLNRPHDQIVDPKSGDVYVIDGNRRLYRFKDLRGAVDVWTFAPNELGYVRGMGWFDGHLHLAGASTGTIVRIDDYGKRRFTTFRSPYGPPQPPASASAGTLVLNDVEKSGDWYYGASFYAASGTAGYDTHPAKLIRWRRWTQFEKGEWEDLSEYITENRDHVVPYFMTIHDKKLYTGLIDVSARPGNSERSCNYAHILELDLATLGAL